MDLIFLPQHWVSLVIVGIIAGAVLFAVLKKWMITYVFLLANLIIFVLTLIFPSGIVGGSGYAGLGFRPVYLSVELFPNAYTVLTSMFIHGGFAHILGNMLVFFFMGTAFEQRIGWKKFLLIYLVTGVCGTLTHSLLDWGSLVPLIGASGAIFGILGAFAFSYPRDEVVMPIPLGIMIITRVKVIYAAILFAAMETLIVWWESSAGSVDNTAHFAHLGGLVSGVILAAVLLRHRGGEPTAAQASGYYVPAAEQRLRTVDFTSLRALAKTPEQQELITRIEHETVPQVRDIWLEHYLERVPCPKCGKPLYHLDQRIWCEECGFRTSY